MNLEKIFFDKELSDVLRDVTINSAITLDDAYVCLKNSDDYKQDSFIIKELANQGFCLKRMLMIIESVNEGGCEHNPKQNDKLQIICTKCGEILHR